MLKNQKTFIISMIYGAAALTEMFGILDFPFIEEPGTHLQVALTAIMLRIGIGKK